ncbi:hypothetical protein CSC82_16470 [Rhodobacteraceae bacterium 4F10]|nr:hypothetical protein CSC82_16470 [Rhodobacteraceae bacterium 4F10]
MNADLLPFFVAGFGLLALFTLLLRRLGRKKRKPRIILDGSNIMHWDNDEPKLSTIAAAVISLKEEGYLVGVFFDANAGYLLCDRYMHDQEFGLALGLPETQIMVVPKGQPADPYLIRAAQDQESRIVTNDKFRDWRDTFPGFDFADGLVRGRFRECRVEFIDL